MSHGTRLLCVLLPVVLGDAKCRRIHRTYDTPLVVGVPTQLGYHSGTLPVDNILYRVMCAIGYPVSDAGIAGFWHIQRYAGPRQVHTIHPEDVLEADPCRLRISNSGGQILHNPHSFFFCEKNRRVTSTRQTRQNPNTSSKDPGRR